MRLYRSKGRVWTGTEADAKAAQGGKDFEKHEVPTDKPGLLKFLNEFDVRPGEKPAVMTVPAVDLPDTEEVRTYIDAVQTYRTPPTSLPAASPDDCPACLRSQRVAKLAVNSTAALSIKADLEDVSDIRSLDEIIRLAQARKAALNPEPLPGGATLQHPPAARVRVRTPA